MDERSIDKFFKDFDAQPSASSTDVVKTCLKRMIEVASEDFENSGIYLGLMWDFIKGLLPEINDPEVSALLRAYSSALQKRINI